MSLKCSNAMHEDCVRDCHGIESMQLTIDEISRRLIAWDETGSVLETKAEHMPLGGRLLKDFA